MIIINKIIHFIKYKIALLRVKARDFDYDDFIKKHANKKIYKLFLQIKANWRKCLFAALTAMYFYGLILNAFAIGMGNFKFNRRTSVLVLNPFRNIASVFTSYGFGMTFFFVVIYCLITKKGYNWLSGTKIKRDERGFNIVDEGTHGTSGWMDKKEIPRVLDMGAVTDIKNPILGKMKDRVDDDDSTSEYVALKDGNGFNKHIIVYGATGSGKSRGFVKPFILQTAKLRQSMILVDPKAEFFESMSGYLEDIGYTVKAFNLLDMENSDGWNPLVETSRNPNMVQTVAEVIMRNTSNPNEGAKQDFWQLAEINLLMALMHYVQTLTYEGTDILLPIHERSLGTIYKILSEENILTLDSKIKMLSKRHPARAPYGIFRQAAHQLWGNIAIGLGSRLNMYQNQLVDKITKYNDIDLVLPGQKPCAYFCIISAQDSSLEFLSSMFFSLLLQRLSNYARTDGINGKLPVEVNFMLEEFCNIGKILDFKKSLAMVRSYGINCQMIVQSLAALAGRYPLKEWNELVNNCNTQLFLGCSDEMTAEFISKRCGYITVQLTNSTAPQTPLLSPVLSSHSARYSQTKSNFSRPLMYPDEIYRLDNRESLIIIQGQKPLKAFKIIPDELPDFKKLRYVKGTEYIPAWRQYETENEAALNEDLSEELTEEPEQQTFDPSSVDFTSCESNSQTEPELNAPAEKETMPLDRYKKNEHISAQPLSRSEGARHFCK